MAGREEKGWIPLVYVLHPNIIVEKSEILENDGGKWRKKGVFYPSDGKKLNGILRDIH